MREEGEWEERVRLVRDSLEWSDRNLSSAFSRKSFPPPSKERLARNRASLDGYRAVYVAFGGTDTPVNGD